MTRRVAAIAALLTAWGSFGLVIYTLFDREIARCASFGDLSAECFGPFGFVFVVVGLVFVAATILLAFLALRLPSFPDGN